MKVSRKTREGQKVYSEEIKGQAQQLNGLEELLNFVGRSGWGGNSFWRLQNEDFKISLGGYGRNSLVPLHFQMRSSGDAPFRRWLAGS